MKLQPPVNAPSVIVVDIDGTLALLNGRNPYDASTCINDLPNEPVVNIVRSYQTVIYVSGREDKHFSQTALWLSKHDLPAGKLFMRKTGDMRKDYIVKRQIFDEHIKDNYKVLFVIDDRPQVIRMWRELGLFVFDVNQSGVEF